MTWTQKPYFCIDCKAESSTAEVMYAHNQKTIRWEEHNGKIVIVKEGHRVAGGFGGVDADNKPLPRLVIGV